MVFAVLLITLGVIGFFVSLRRLVNTEKEARKAKVVEKVLLDQVWRCHDSVSVCVGFLVFMLGLMWFGGLLVGIGAGVGAYAVMYWCAKRDFRALCDEVASKR